MIIRVFLVALSIVVINVTGVMSSGYSLDKSKVKTMYVSGGFYKRKFSKSYKRIVKTHKQLKKVKKYIKKNYNSSEKYLKNLGKYGKKFFKKNTLFFVTENNDMNSKQYSLISVEKSGKTLVLNVERKIIIQKGVSSITSIIEGSNSYYIAVKKSKAKKIKKIKVKYKDTFFEADTKKPSSTTLVSVLENSN